MIRSILCAALILLAANLSGCATMAGADGSAANTRLQRDVMRMISMYESAATGDEAPTLLSTEPVEIRGSTHIERWIVESAGAPVSYKVELTPEPGGGVTFSVLRLDKPPVSN